ncbi:MAG: HD domain-containing protein [Halobacteriales archaeon]
MAGVDGDRLPEVVDRLHGEEATAYVEAQNVNAVDRLGYNDHGTEHIEIVQRRCLELLALLRGDVDWGVEDHDLDLTYEDACVVCVTAAAFHDVGHMVHRRRHAEHSVALAAPLVDDVLDFYPTRERVALKGDVLHAIVSHHSGTDPLTPEAGIVRVADALDMEEGRSRMPYSAGQRSIDTVSSQAIQRVSVLDGEAYDVPVLVEIQMTNSAGVYQIDGLLKSKLEGSGLEHLVRIVAVNEGEDEIVGRIEL